MFTRRPRPQSLEEKPFFDEDDEIDNIVDYADEMGEFRNDDWYKKPRDEMRGVAVAVMPEQNVYAARPERKLRN